MGRTCCVPDCRSNSDRYSPCVTTFRLPQNVDRRNEWLRRIWRQDLADKVTQNTVVCIKHFAPQHVITSDRIKTRDGVIEMPRKIPKLTEDAFPSVFPNWAAHYSIPVPAEQCETQTEEIELAEKRAALTQKRKEVEADKIKNFEELKSSKADKYTHFLKLPTQTYVLFYKIQDHDFSSAPKITISFKISADFSVSAFQNNESLPCKKLEQFLGSTLKCDMWSKLECLSNFFETYNVTTASALADRVKYFSLSIREILSAENDLDEETATKLEFLSEQLDLTFMTCIRYSPKMLIWAATLFYSYPAAYKSMRLSKCLTLPYPGYLQRFLVKIGNNDPGLGPTQIAFLKEKFKLLDDIDKVVSVLLDEIYVTPRFVYKGGRIFGLAQESNHESDISAGTLQAFMYNSLKSKNKDVIALFPVRSLTSEILHKLALQVLQVMEEVGFRVLCMSCDDNQVNVKMYKLLADGTLKISIPHPYNPDEELFLLFDSVHLFKNCRNNWLNAPQKTLKIPKIEWNQDDSSFCIPDKDNLLDFSGLEEDLKGIEVETLEAKFSNVINVFNAEMNSVTKLAPKLNRKTVYPSSVERQNVQLVVNLFHDTTIAALKTLKEDGIITDCEGSIIYLQLLGRWWKISNVKNEFKGKRINDSWCTAIYFKEGTEDWKLTFFRKFKEYLEFWHSLEGDGKLTAQTYTAFIHNLEAVLSLCVYVSQKFGWDHILLGKLQTDGVEGRFGGYRRLSGCNYHVSVEQVCESERKLKLIGVLKLTSNKGGVFSIKTFGEDCEKTSKGIKVAENLDYFEPAIVEAATVKVSINDSSVLICLSSYCATKVIQHFSKTKNKICSGCIEGLVSGEPLEIERADEIYGYLSAIDRGGLKKPSQFTFDLCVEIFKLFKTLISKKYEEQFLKLQVQHRAVVDLGLQMFESFVDNLIPECRTCELKTVKVIKKILRSMANCLLKNYTKNLQESNTSRQIAIHLSKKAAKEEKIKQKASNAEEEVPPEDGPKSTSHVAAIGKLKDPEQRKLVKLNPDRLGVKSNTQRSAARKQDLSQTKTVQQSGIENFKRTAEENSSTQPLKVVKIIPRPSCSSTIVLPKNPGNSTHGRAPHVLPSQRHVIQLPLNKENVNPHADPKQQTVIRVVPAQQANENPVKRQTLQSIENTSR